jgi:hypothetical protein
MTNAQRLQRWSAGAAAALVCAAPAIAGASGPAPTRLVGTYSALVPNYPSVGWYKGNYRLALGPGRAFAVRSIPGIGTILYTASFTGTRMTLPAGSGCSTAGTYTWILKGRSLVFAALNEPCHGRAVMLVRRWTRVP